MPAKPALFFTRPTLLALAAAACASAIAQENTQTLSEVVVSAAGFEQQIKDAPASISVVTREELEKKSFRDLGEALQGVEGIDVKGGTGKTGGMDISIRGMPSSYTLILVDGRRLSPAGDTTPNGFGTSQTSLIPPVSAIERIEVIRGPMSTLYGSDAMGGVINIITRKIGKTWGGSVQVEGSLPENSGQGAAQKSSFYFSGPIQEDKLGLSLRGNYFNRDQSNIDLPGTWSHTSIKGVAPTKSDQYTVGARLTASPSSNHQIWLDAETAKTKYDNRNCELGTLDNFICNPGDKASISGYADELRFNREQLAIGYKGNFHFGNFESSLTHSKNETLGRTLPANIFTTTNDPRAGTARKLESSSTIWDTKLVTPLNDSNLLSLGSQYIDSTAKDGIPQIAGEASFKQTTWAVFAENEWSITESLIGTGGLRYDHHDKFGGHWTPRTYLAWNATDTFTFKGGISKGFRAPSVNQMVNGISGVSGQGKTTTFGNPNLKPEESTSLEFGMLFNNQKGWSGNITAFKNKIKNKITSEDCEANSPFANCNTLDFANGEKGSYSINRDRGETKGIELGSKYIFNPQWNISGNYTWSQTKLFENNNYIGEFSNTPKHMANATLNWQPNQKLSFWLQAEYRGSAQRFGTNTKNALTNENRAREIDAVGELKGYSLFNFGTQYKVNKNLTVSATINNLFNKDFLKFEKWMQKQANDKNGNPVADKEVWANPYIGSGSSVRGNIPDGRTLWLRANLQF